MKTLLRLFTLALLALALISPKATAQLSLQLRPDHRLLIRWQADAGTTQLIWTDALGNPTAWQPLGGVQPMGGNRWQAEFNAALPKAFFSLRPPGPPVAPPNVRLVPLDDHLQVEWDSTSDAGGYVLYVGLDATVGPGNAVRTLVLPASNAVEVIGLDPGVTYYIAIAATNSAGEGSLSAPVSGVFGPKGFVAGTAIRTFATASGGSFTVLAEGANVRLLSASNPAAEALTVITDQNGQFRFRHVPVGPYIVGYGYQGEVGFLPGTIDVTVEGLALTPLIIPAGPQPPPAGSTLIGTLSLSDGSAARCDIPEFDIHVNSAIRALLASGEERIIHPDRTGAWAITGLTSADYPLSLNLSYASLPPRTVPLASPPADLTPLSLQFSEVLPSVRRVSIFQNGHEVQTIARGVPVTVVGEIENPENLPLEPRWIAEFNGQKQLATGLSPTFVFSQPDAPIAPGLGDPRDSGLVLLTLLPTGIQHPGPPNGWQLDVEGTGCWSGLAAEWSPYGPVVVVGTEPATITVKHSGPLSPSTTNTISGKGGYFELPVSPTSVPPYLVRVEKPGYMRFLWPFESRLPVEATYSVTAATSTYRNQTPSGPQVITHALFGHELTIPWGAVLDPFNQPWFGDIVVTMAAFDPFTRSPLPPGAEVRGPNLRNGIFPYGAVWFDITDNTGVPLTPTSACTLTFSLSPTYTVNTMPGYHQVESTGYFERWGHNSGPDAIKTGPGKYTVTLGTKGLFMVGFDYTLMELFIENDRTLGYPYEVLVNTSIFPVTVLGYHQLNIGKLFLPRNVGVRLQAIDPREGPGLRYTDPASPSTYLSAMQKTPVVDKNVPVLGTPLTLPAIGTYSVNLSLADSEPDLATVSTTIAALNNTNHFFSRGIINSAADGQDYYTRINAPPTLSQWRALNGFPTRFGGPLTGVSADDYATAYYYNLGDLGFARAQTMRIRLSTIDGGYDTAFQVTNYPTLEDAICGRGAIATVCMDFAKRTDAGAQTPTRYTRFYVYGSDNLLKTQANLDGAGLKGIPNLCVQCHGGNFYDGTDPNRTPNLGSRFLPFDLEAFTYHPKFGVQRPELARMNKGVLLTGPTAATSDLIAGWYANPNPLANPLAFFKNYVPVSGSLSWAGNQNLYRDVFKPGCRVCHNSRETTNFAQFGSLSSFQSFGYGNFQAGSSLAMPHAQRTWSIFWGSRGAVNLGHPVPDMPTILGTAAGNVYR